MALKSALGLGLAILLGVALPAMADGTSRDWAFDPGGSQGISVDSYGPSTSLGSYAAVGARIVWSWSPFYGVYNTFFDAGSNWTAPGYDLQYLTCGPGSGCSWYYMQYCVLGSCSPYRYTPGYAVAMNVLYSSSGTEQVNWNWHDSGGVHNLGTSFSNGANTSSIQEYAAMAEADGCPNSWSDTFSGVQWEDTSNAWHWFTGMAGIDTGSSPTFGSIQGSVNNGGTMTIQTSSCP